MTTARGALRLVRVSIALTPACDVIAGAAVAVALGADFRMVPVVAGALAATFLFLFGMAQNDLCDRDKDRAARPERPIPSGAVSVVAARTIVAATAVLALGFAFVADVAGTEGPAVLVIAASMLAAIAVYNTAPGHLKSAGPPWLGAIRAADLGLGVAAIGDIVPALPVLAAYGAYVTLVSVVARMEDGEIRASVPLAAGLLRSAAIVALAPAILLAPHVRSPSHAVSAVAACAFLAFRLERALRAARAASADPRAFQRLAGAGLSGLFLFDAAACFAAGAPLAGAAIVGAFFAGGRLVRRFPPS